MIKKIRSEKKISIDIRLENWINDQRIEREWSSKNIFEQNDKSERFDVLLTEKARCIREFFKLFEDLYSECYLAVAHLLNRTSMLSDWQSSLIRLQRLFKKSIRWEIDHLKIFDCKAYVLLKDADVSPRSEKMKARAFVDYLIDYDSINIFRIWNLEKDDVNDYKDVIFDENTYYDIYDKDKRHLIKKSERKNFVQFRIYSVKSTVDFDLNSDEKKWLKTSIRDRLMLKNRKERAIENSINQTAEMMKKSVQMNDDSEQLSTSFESLSSQHVSSQIISLRSGLTEDDRISRFQSEDAEDAVESSNVTIRRKNKRKKSQLFEFDQFSQSDLSAIDQTSLDVTKIQIDLKEFHSSRNIESADLNQTNILSSEKKRTRKSTSRYAQIVWENEEMRKFSSFHATFMIELIKSTYVNQSNQLNLDQLNSKNRSHISNLSFSSAHWRAMLRHPHAEKFRKAAQIEYDAIENRDTWQIVNRLDENQQIISLKWIFIYKTDSNDYLIKYKVRIMIRDDLQMIDSQDVYAITLASKMFRILMTLVAAFDLKTRQLNAINAFLNAHNDELIYCQMSDDYRLDEKVIKIIRALYEQRKSFLLWLRMLITKCLKMRLRSISKESCLFMTNEIFMFFYVDDIVFAYRVDRKHAAELLINKLKDIFEMRDLDILKFFLDVRIIQKSEMIYLVQDAYAEKLIKKYEIFTNQKIFTSLSYQSLTSYSKNVDSDRVHEYRQKMKSICYFVIIIRSDLIKVAFKLAEFLINFDLYHLIAADHCIRYMHSTRYLAIKFDVSESEELIIQIDSNKHVFETSVDASFANEEERRSDEDYIFKLFDKLIDWTARKQVIISTSITEIELLAMLHADKEFIWWIHLFEKLRFDLDQKMIIYNDNLQIIRLFISKIAKMNTKLRHVDIAQCWLRQSIQQEKIGVEYLSTAHMMTNEMIKLLLSQRHEHFIQQLELMNVKSLMNDQLEISR